MIDLEKMARAVAETAEVKYSESLGEYVNREEVYRVSLKALREAHAAGYREAVEAFDAKQRLTDGVP